LKLNTKAHVMIQYVTDRKKIEKIMFLVFDSCINCCHFSAYHYDHNGPFWI